MHNPLDKKKCTETDALLKEYFYFRLPAKGMLKNYSATTSKGISTETSLWSLRTAT